MYTLWIKNSVTPEGAYVQNNEEMLCTENLEDAGLFTMEQALDAVSYINAHVDDAITSVRIERGVNAMETIWQQRLAAEPANPEYKRMDEP